VGCPSSNSSKSRITFVWDDEAKRSFQELKDYLQVPPILTPPEPNAVLLMYILAMTHVVSKVLEVERTREGHAYGVQCPVYFIHQ